MELKQLAITVSVRAAPHQIDAVLTDKLSVMEFLLLKFHQR
jgi:hypothetical protein